MIMCEVERRYLENPVGVPLAHPEMLDGHGGAQILSIAHVCESTVVINPPDVYELLLDDV